MAGGEPYRNEEPGDHQPGNVSQRQELHGRHDDEGTQGTPEFAKAARVSMVARGDGRTAWSKAWRIGLWARMRDGNRAHDLVKKIVGEETNPYWMARKIYDHFHRDG